MTPKEHEALPDPGARGASRGGVAVRLAKFFKFAADACWEGFDLEGGDIQDRAKALGLFKVESYDPDKHGSGYVDPGEDWYMLADDVQALLASDSGDGVPATLAGAGTQSAPPSSVCSELLARENGEGV